VGEQEGVLRMIKKIITLFFCLPLLVRAEIGAETPSDLAKLLDLDLAALALVEFSSSATLSKVPLEDVPATVTVITREEIRNSSARHLFELLEIYVPAFTFELDMGQSSIPILRGQPNNSNIILLIDGHVSMDFYAEGSLISRFSSLMGDIEKIEIIRGVGSSTLGPGALAGIISITTSSGKNFEGFQAKARGGTIEEFANAEFRYGHKFSEDRYFSAFYGVDKYHGSSGSDSPTIIGQTGGGFTAGQKVSSGVPRYNMSFLDRPRHRLHLKYEDGDLTTWLRVTREGLMQTNPDFNTTAINTSQKRGIGLDQLIFFVDYSKQLTDSIRWRGETSFDVVDRAFYWENNPFTLATAKNPEVHSSNNNKEWLARSGLSLRPSNKHKLALDYEYRHRWFGDDAWGFPNRSNDVEAITPDAWEVDLHALITEYQYRPNDEWILMFTGRADKHSLTDFWLFSPRLAAIYKSDRHNSFKFIFNQAKKVGAEVIIKNINRKDDNEVLDEYQFIYAHKSDSGWDTELSAYYNDHDFIGFSFALSETLPLGTLQYAGAELAFNYRKDDWHLIFSQSYNKLLDLKLNDPTTVDSVSASPQGFGNDFQDSDNHITKLYGSYRYNDKVTIDSSMLVFWGKPGKKDEWQDRRGLEITPETYRKSARWNAGLNWQIDDKTRLRFDAHNILGWIDEDFNKRSIRAQANYIAEAPAFSASLEYNF
jgi:outer membrane receptor protein involved in Fe transport